MCVIFNTMLTLKKGNVYCEYCTLIFHGNMCTRNMNQSLHNLGLFALQERKCQYTLNLSILEQNRETVFSSYWSNVSTN